MTKFAMRLSMVVVEVANDAEEAKAQAIAYVRRFFPLQTRTMRVDSIKGFDHEKEAFDQGL